MSVCSLATSRTLVCGLSSSRSSVCSLSDLGRVVVSLAIYCLFEHVGARRVVKRKVEMEMVHILTSFRTSV